MMWLAVGLKIAKIGIAAFNMVEESKTSDKGVSKTNLARRFADNMIGGCNETDPARDLLMTNPRVREAFDKYSKAYVDLQNIVAEETRAAAGVGVPK